MSRRNKLCYGCLTPLAVGMCLGFLYGKTKNSEDLAPSSTPYRESALGYSICNTVLEPITYCWVRFQPVPVGKWLLIESVTGVIEAAPDGAIGLVRLQGLSDNSASHVLGSDPSSWRRETAISSYPFEHPLRASFTSGDTPTLVVTYVGPLPAEHASRFTLNGTLVDRAPAAPAARSFRDVRSRLKGLAGLLGFAY